jgi:hypothetical protein
MAVTVNCVRVTSNAKRSVFQLWIEDAAGVRLSDVFEMTSDQVRYVLVGCIQKKSRVDQTSRKEPVNYRVMIGDEALLRARLKTF